MADGFRPSRHPYAVSFVPLGRAVPLRVRLGSPRLMLWLKYDYVVEPSAGPADSFEVRMVGYRVQVLDRQEREILAYHWHPFGASRVISPHLHLSSRIKPFQPDPASDPIVLADMHLPTASVSLAAIGRLLITEFKVEPRRIDWEAVLEQSPATS